MEKMKSEARSREAELEFRNTLEFAQQQDEQDLLKSFRSKFFIPQHNNKDTVYLTGNSLGLQPKSTVNYINQELKDWAAFGVEGHFKAKNPWVSYHEQFAKPISKLVGANPDEVVVMNQLTVNLHLLLTTFYRPTKERFKIICEAKAFPSDQYALESQVKLHSLNANEAIFEVAPRENEFNIRLEDIQSTIQQHGNSVAVVFFGGVNYYSGQLMDIKSITTTAHAVGAYAGFDLAHAAGNISLQLHDWNVD
ncbi:MAG: kynureninase, partial [Chitinophagaceae bacterium]